MGLWQEQHRSDAVLFSLRALGWHVVWKCSLTDDVHSHHLIKVIFTSYLHCKVFVRGLRCFETVSLSKFKFMYYLLY